jgi:hypothetical protein
MQRTTDRLGLLAVFLLMSALCWQPDRAFSLSAGSEPANTTRDGQHDFDFNIGGWHTHIKRILDPLSGSMELNGTVTVRKIWVKM